MMKILMADFAALMTVVVVVVSIALFYVTKDGIREYNKPNSKRW